METITPPPAVANDDAIDPLGRAGAIGIAAVRAALGVAIFTSPNKALGALGFSDPDPATVTIARLAGGRDIALGMHGLANANEKARLRESVAIGALVDAGDALAFGLLLGQKGQRKTALKNIPIAGAAVVAGAYLLSRI